MAKHCAFRSASACGFIESKLSPCPSCPFREVVVSLEEILVRIHGEQGPQGPTGIEGQEGSRGVNGAQGDTGLVGSNGARGLTGLKGAQGPSGLPGPEGAKGDRGDRGDKGDRGSKGDEVTTDEEKLKALIRRLDSGGRGQVLLGWNRGAAGPAGGELGGTYPNPTVNSTHSGSPHQDALRYAYLVG